MAKFIGYFAGWDKCPECGMRLVRAGRERRVLRHRNGWLVTHKLILQKKAEGRAI